MKKLLCMILLAIAESLPAAQMNVDTKEQAEKIELTAQEQAAADRMFEIINATNKDNAAQQAQMLQRLLRDYPRIVNEKGYLGNTALILAAWEGHTALAQALIAAGADLNAKDNDGDTALMRAAWKGHATIVQALIAADADEALQNNVTQTALGWATEYGHRDAYIAAVAAGLAERQEHYKQVQRKILSELDPHLIPPLAKITTEYAYNIAEKLPALPVEQESQVK